MAEAEDDPERKSPTIATSANQCLQSFQKCLISASSINPRELSMVEDQVARFSSWAAGIGVFAPGSASMDHRLRYAPEVQSVVTGLLESLNYQCQECLGILTTILKSLEAGDEYVAAEEFPKSLNEIASEISRLNKISNTIRRASKDTQALTANKFHIKDDEGNNVEETLLDNFKLHINDRFPNLGETLQERLARTMLLRRKQILYRRHRQGSVYTKTQDTIPVVSIMFPTAKPAISLIESKSKQPRTSSTVSKPATITPSQIKSATTLAPEKFRIAASTPSVISASKTIAFHSHESLVFPPAPGHVIKKRYEQLKSQRLAEYEQILKSEKVEDSNTSTLQELLANDLHSLGEITCPYCLCAVPAEEAFDETKWQNHVKNDLDAYICLFEDCDQPDVLYNHSDQWLSHLQQHRKFWRCPSHHDLEPFPSANDYITHMREVHVSKLSDKQLRAMANKNSRKMKILFPSCPLCGKEEPDIKGRLEDHLAGHLRSIALTSLPSYHENTPGDNEDGNNSIDVSRPKSRSTVKDLRKDEDYVPQHLFTSEDFWDQWRPPLVQDPWWNFLEQTYEDLDLTVNDTSLFFDTYSFRDLPNTFQNDSIIQHIMQRQEKLRQTETNEHSKDRKVAQQDENPNLMEAWLRQSPEIDIWGRIEPKTTKDSPSPTLSSVSSNGQYTSGVSVIPSVPKASSVYVSPHGEVPESSKPYQIEKIDRHTNLPYVPESSGSRRKSVTYEADEGLIRIQDQNRRGRRSASNPRSRVYINGQRVSYDGNNRHLSPPENDIRYTAHSPPVLGPPSNTPSSYYDVDTEASRGRTIFVDEQPSSSSKYVSYPDTVDNTHIAGSVDRKSRSRVEYIYSDIAADTRTISSASTRTSEYERLEEGERRLRQRIAEANSTIAGRSAARAPATTFTRGEESRRIERQVAQLREKIHDLRVKNQTAQGNAILRPASPATLDFDRLVIIPRDTSIRGETGGIGRLYLKEDSHKDEANILAMLKQKGELEDQRERLWERMPRRARHRSA